LLLPEFPDSEAQGRAGVMEVGLVVSKMKWIFREQPVPDTGIDCHIETRDDWKKPTGKLIGCQVKSGPSYLDEETESSFVYRGKPEHLSYWLGHSLPVIVILCDEETGNCYWQVVSEKTATRTPKGWKIEVPKAQILGEQSKPGLEQIASTGWLERTRTFTTPDKFFRRSEVNPLFDYEQKLQGRSSSLAELHNFLQDDKTSVAVLAGRGGIGKSKLIRHWVSEVSGWRVLFKKETVSVGETTQQELDGGERCVVIVDDAHRQPDIDAFLQFARDLKTDGKAIKVLLSCRPIGLQRIDAALSRSFDPTAVVRLKELKRLGDADARALSEEVLGPGYLQLAPYLVSVSKDTPLVTVIGGRLLRRGAAPAHDLPTTEDFRRAVFDKFLDDFETAAQRGPKNARPLLHLVSALQPLALRAKNVIANCAAFLKWEDFEVCQCIDELESSGLLIRSGRKYRIAPDMFADFLLEQASLGQTGTSNGYADAVYGSFGNEYLANLLQNLAELDFRTLDQGQASLLANVWGDIRLKFEKAGNFDKMQLLEAIESAAFYQPDPVMQLVRLVMEASSQKEDIDADEIYNFSEQDVLKRLPTLLRAIAHQPAYREEAIRRLWELAKDGSRLPSAYPEHALRILKQLAAYSRYKPVDFNLEIAKIARVLCSEPNAFRGNHTPLDVVDEMLKREGEEQESAGMTITLFNYKVIAPVRSLCLQTLQECLSSSDARAACRAFHSLSRLIHGFLPAHAVTDEEIRWQSEERVACLSMVADRLAAGDVSLPLAREIKADLEGFVARGHNEEANERARSVLGMLPATPHLAAFDAFCSGDWDIRGPASTGMAIAEAMQHNRDLSREAATAFRNQFATVGECISELARFYVWARDCHITPNGSNELVHNLCDEPEFLTNLASELRSGTYSPDLADTAQVVLRRLRERGGSEYPITALSASRSHDLVLARSAAVAMRGIEYDPANDDDLTILDEMAGHSDWHVQRSVVFALSAVGKHPGRLEDAIERILSFSPGEDKKLADEICDAFLYNRIPLDSLSEAHLDRLLDNLVSVPDLDEHGISMVLNWAVSNRSAAIICFIKKRIQQASERKAARDWSYSIVPRHQNQIDLHNLTNSAELLALRAFVLGKIEANESMGSDLIDLFWDLTLLDADSFETLRLWLHSSDASKFDLAIGLLHGAPGKLAFSNRDQILETLEAAEKLGGDHLTRAIGYFVSNVQPSTHLGLAGGQTPAIVDLGTSADAALTDPQLHPLLKRLYEAIKKSASIDLRPFSSDEDEEEF
jgi:hypothetical protein